MVQNVSATRLADLWRLQEIDIALDSRRGSLADAETRVGESEEVIAARTRQDALLLELRRLQSAQRDLETEASDLRAKIAPQEAKLYSGTIKNPKELAGLQADIDQMKRHLTSVEDRDLDALAAVEAAERETQAAAAELDAMESAWRVEQEELAGRITRLTAEIAHYEQQRNETAHKIDPQLLKMYDRLRVAHQGRALARLDRNLCTGCRISLPTNVVNRAKAGNVLVQCPNCERILVM